MRPDLIRSSTGTVVLASGHRAEVEYVHYGDGPWGPAGEYAEVTFISDDGGILWAAPDYWVADLDVAEVDPVPEPVEPPASDVWFVDQQYTEAA